MEPIVSIYDLMMKRHKQHKKDELPLKEPGLTKLETLHDLTKIANERSPNEARKGRYRPSRSMVASESQLNMMGQMPSNVVTATHLTQKQSVIRMPTTKKEALNQLAQKMSHKKHKSLIISPMETYNLGKASPKEAHPGLFLSPKKPKLSNKVKQKRIKTSRGSTSSNSRRRLALSPRNTNRLNSIKVDKQNKTKATSTIDSSSNSKNQPKSPIAVRPKSNIDTLQSKMSIKSKLVKTPSDENAVRYRL